MLTPGWQLPRHPTCGARAGSARARCQLRSGRASSHLHQLPPRWPPLGHPARGERANSFSGPEKQHLWRASRSNPSRSWPPPTSYPRARRIPSLQGRGWRQKSTAPAVVSDDWLNPSSTPSRSPHGKRALLGSEERSARRGGRRVARARRRQPALNRGVNNGIIPCPASHVVRMQSTLLATPAPAAATPLRPTMTLTRPAPTATQPRPRRALTRPGYPPPRLRL